MRGSPFVCLFVFAPQRDIDLRHQGVEAAGFQGALGGRMHVNGTRLTWVQMSQKMSREAPFSSIFFRFLTCLVSVLVVALCPLGACAGG